MLEITQLRAGYGAINVLWDASLSVPEGQVTALIGPNGAGKTTLLRAVMGLVIPNAGEITLDGQSLASADTWNMSGRGVVMIPEGRMVFADMSVEENLILGAFAPAKRAGVARGLEQAYGLFPRLAERRKQLAGSLSGGEAQMLALARGLMSEPRLLLVDEPSLGLAPVIVHEIFAILAMLKAQGRSILLVEQNTHMAVGLADTVHLMQGGRIVYSEPAASVNLDRLHDLYFAR